MGFPLKLRNLKPATCLKDTEVYTTDGIINQRNGVQGYQLTLLNTISLVYYNDTGI